VLCNGVACSVNLLGDLSGYQIFHNYIRPHEGLDRRTPAEACGIKIEGKNKWMTLIQNAKASQT